MLELDRIKSQDLKQNNKEIKHLDLLEEFNLS